MKRLPDSEFEVMKAIWSSEAPITANIIMEKLGNQKEWKIQTAISLLSRLANRGFIKSVKEGRDRVYYPLIKREEYLQSETGNFMKQYHENSFINFVNTLYDSKNINDNDVEELMQWVKERWK